MFFDKLNPKQKKYSFIAFVALLYAGRLLYMYLGYLKNYNWLANEDESHIYLLGLKFFTDHTYPYWGPDIVYSSSFLVGGMQGLLIGIPLFIYPHPFSPYLFLFFLLSISMIYLSWYISKLFPYIPKWLIYVIVALAPFSVHTGLKILNPAYVLCLSIPFMMSLIKVFKIFPKQYINPRWGFFWMGLGVSIVFQLHASWIFLCFLLLVASIYTFWQKKNLSSILYLYITCIIGLLVGSLSILPTLVYYGADLLTQQGKSLGISIYNIADLGPIVYYFITSCGYEMNSFSDEYRWSSLWSREYKLSALTFALLQTTGLLLVIFQLIFPFLPKWRTYVIENKRMLILNGGIICLLASMYMISSVRPGAHAIIAIYPLSAIYLCWFVQGLIINTKIKYSYFSVFFGLLVFY